MAAEFDRKRFLAQLAGATAQIETAAALGADLARHQPERLVFVGCGAPNQAMAIVQYWIEHTTTLEIRRFYPAELINQAPPALDARTVVVLGSNSGTTAETVAAAEYLRQTGATTVGITQYADSPLGQAVDHVLPYGQSTEGYYAGSILLQALAGSFLDALAGWALFQPVMASLPALPGALADAAEANEVRAIADASRFQADRVLYITGSGPGFSTAYVFGVCILMEMQRLHCQPIAAAEFFHGPFEVVDETTPLILLVGEDPSRPLAERVVTFCHRYGERLMIYDSAEVAMAGVAPAARPVFAPYVQLAQLERMAEHFAVLHDHPLSTRRYMGKVEY